MTRNLKIYDSLILVLALAATGFGLVFAFDAGYPRSIAAGHGAIPPEFRTQLIMFVLSLVAGALMSTLSGERWYKLSKIIWFVAFISLFLPMVPGLKYTQGGADRWFKLPLLPPVQPAEFVKFAAILYLAGLFAKRKPWQAKPARDWASFLDRNWSRKFKRILPALYVVIACVVIEKEPDMGTAAVVAMTAFVMFVVGGVSKWTLIIGSLVAIVSCSWLVTHEQYRMDRINNHFDRWSEQNRDDIGWQTVQSELGMASGGIIGVGPGAGRAKHVLPAATTDFVDATIGEEFGLFGVLLILAILGALSYRLMQLAKKANSPFASFVLAGTAAWIGIQACVNVMMANGMLPAIGIPLPFVSSGGSSLLSLWIALGVCNAVLAPATQKEESLEARRNRWRHRRTRLSRA